ncbi:MAG TPA: cysteine--tRNA ligase, partial [Epsilonproteobacteria bacterium]|nr:cysteine--tRNA ligase [Campylobacterota bacterium]
MYIFDSVQKKRLKFESLNPNQVTLYVCGPTVYDDAHLGHARSAITFDLLVRVLRANGYKTTFIRNITDIDDKIIAKMRQEEKTLQEITQFYTDRYLEEMDTLGVLPPSLSPKATESIDAIISMITTLLQKGCAYQ